MKILAFTIYDEKAEAFGRPFFTTAIGVASRDFSEAINDGKSLLSKHPEDFSLYHIGYFDDHSCKFDSNATPTLIGRGTDYAGTMNPKGFPDPDPNPQTNITRR